MAYQTSLPPGLLSFAYNAVYNQQVIQDIRNNNLNELMAQFELTEQEKEVIYKALNDRQVSDQDLQAVVDLIKPYLAKAVGDVW